MDTNLSHFRSQGAVAHAKPVAAITNIAQMMEALAVGWAEGAPTNRSLIAAEDPYNTRYVGHQFIRTPENRFSYPFDKMSTGDIPVDSGYYSLRGFIQFEARDQFRGLFEVSAADDRVWWRATLTARGAELARSGVLLDFAGLRDTPFFSPVTSDIAIDAAIPFAAKQIGGAT